MTHAQHWALPRCCLLLHHWMQAQPLLLLHHWMQAKPLPLLLHHWMQAQALLLLVVRLQAAPLWLHVAPLQAGPPPLQMQGRWQLHPPLALLGAVGMLVLLLCPSHLFHHLLAGPPVTGAQPPY